MLATTTRTVPVLLMVAGFIGFVACVVVALINVRTDLLALAGLCAFVACGGYLSQAIAAARKLPDPPTPPMAPEPPTVGTPEPEEA